MRQPISDKHKFWQVAPAADEIFKYVENEPEVSESPWGFDTGNMSEDLTKVWANFSCVAVSGWGNDNLTVTATKQADDSWEITHSVRRAT